MKSTQAWRAAIEDSVHEWDTKGEVHGSVVETEMRKALVGMEPDVFLRYGICVTGREEFAEVVTALPLSRSVLLATTAKLDNESENHETTGITFTNMFDGPSVYGFDSHEHTKTMTIGRKCPAGMPVWKMDQRDAVARAGWIYDFLLPAAACQERQIDLVIATLVPWWGIPGRASAGGVDAHVPGRQRGQNLQYQKTSYHGGPV